MPLDADVKAKVQASFEKYEGRVPHMYLDSVGQVTIGVGCLLATRNAVTPLPLYKSSLGIFTQLATQLEKLDEYDRVKKQPKGYKAAHYRTPDSLLLKDLDITMKRDEQIESFYRNLTRIYSEDNGYSADFDDMPCNVQLALFDMIFNLGPGKIVRVFAQFDKAIKAGDWKKAADQCNRPQISALRNQYVKNLLLNAK